MLGIVIANLQDNIGRARNISKHANSVNGVLAL